MIAGKENLGRTTPWRPWEMCKDDITAQQSQSRQSFSLYICLAFHRRPIYIHKDSAELSTLIGERKIQKHKERNVVAVVVVSCSSVLGIFGWWRWGGGGTSVAGK
jgi:hypothetical protein